MARAAAGALTFPFGVAVGTGVGAAVGTTIEPRLRGISNEAWRRFHTMPLEAVQAAQLVADGERPMDWGKDEALNMGVSGDRFEALVDMIDTAPDLGVLYDLRRRKLIGAALFRTGLKRHGIEDAYLDALVERVRALLSPDELANAVVQGFRAFDDAAADAELHGVERADFQTMVDVTGLPPGPETLLEWLRRGITDDAGVAQGIREGHTKVKYIDEYLRARWRVLSAAEYAGLHLRGHISEAERNAGGALTGYTPADMELLYLNRGRPATSRQVHIGYARGGRLAGSTADERTIHRQAIAQSNIRPEYEPILWAQRYTYPSAFVLRALVEDGTFDQATAEKILLEMGWVPEYAHLAAVKWSGGEAGVSAKWADRARTRLFTVTHDEYLDASIDEAQARTLLNRVGAADAERDTIISLWNAERDTFRRELTPAQWRKLYKAGRRTLDESLQALDEMGYEPDDARDFLET